MKSKSTSTKICLQSYANNMLHNYEATNLFNQFRPTSFKRWSLLMVLGIFFLSATQIFAQIAQRGTSTTGTTTGTNLTINRPTGVVTGDIMIVNISKVGNNTTDPAASGWTLIDGADLAGGTLRYGAVLYRVATGSEGASYTFTLGSGTTAAVGSIVAFSGVNGTTPFDLANGLISVQGSQTGVAAATKTTITANAAVIMFGMAASSSPTWSGWTTTSPGALTELYDNQIAGDATVGAAWALKPVAGATGAGAATLSASERNGGILVVLRPAAAPSTFTSTGAGGPWNTAATWSPASVPTAGSTVTIATGAPVTVDVNTAAVANLTVNSSLDASTFTVSGTGTLTVSGTGTLLVGANNFPTGFTTTTLSSGSTVNYDGTAQTVSPQSYSNLTLSGSGIKTLTGLTTVGGNLTLSGSATAATAAGLTIGGNLAIGDGTTFTASGFAFTVTGTTTVGSGTSGSLIISSATGAKQFTGLVTVASGATWNNSGNSPLEFRGGITTVPTFTGGSGVHTFSTNAQALTGTFSIPSILVNSITLTNNGTLTSTTALDGTGGFTNASTGFLNIDFAGAVGITTFTATAAGNTVDYGFAGTQTVRGISYSNLTLSTSGIKTLGAATVISGNLTINTSVVANLSGTANTANALLFGAAQQVAGTWGNTGSGATNINSTYFSGTGRVTIATSSCVAGTWTGATSINWNISTNWCDGNVPTASTNVIIPAGGNQPVIGAAAVCNNLTVNSGASLTITGTTTLTISGNWTNSGTFIPNTSTVIYNAAGPQTCPVVPYNNLTLTGSGTKTLGAATVVNGNLTISGSAIANLSGTANSANVLYFGAVQQVTGTWGATGSGATNINNTLFSGSGRLLVTTSLVPSLEITSGIANHGSSCVGVPAPQQTYTITNTGGTVTGVSVSSNSVQFVVSNLSSTTIAGSGGTATFVVTFTPVTSGVKTADIFVLSSTPGVEVTTTLTGTGISAIAGLTSSDPDNIICDGDAVTFTATGGISYQFFVGGVSQGPASAASTFLTSTLTTGQIVTVTATNSNGCFGTSTGIATTVNPLPETAPITGNQSISVGSIATLGTPVSGGIWSSGTEAVATVNNNGEVLGISVGTSLIRYTVSNGTCTNFSTLLVTVSIASGIEDLQSAGGLVLKNHPNPFVGNTIVNYILPFDGRVTLTIRSLTGQVMKTLINEMEVEGEYTLNLEVGDLQSGVYFATLRLKANGKELTKTIRMVKGK